jgi:Ca-activated chloride channel family protein
MWRIYAEIDSLEKTEVEVKKYEHFDELYRPVGLGGLGLFLLEIILSHTVWRKLP